MRNDAKTSGLKLSELRPCDICGGKIIPQFYIFEIKFALFSNRGTNEVLGLTQMFGGITNPGALAIAETMSANGDRAVVVSEDETLNSKLFLCQQCYLFKTGDIGLAIERMNERARKAEEAKDVSTGL